MLIMCRAKSVVFSLLLFISFISTSLFAVTLQFTQTPNSTSSYPFTPIKRHLLEQTTPATPSTPGLKIGTVAFNPPFEMNNPQKQVYSGLEMDIMMEVCRRLKINCEFTIFPSIAGVVQALNKEEVLLGVASIIVLKGEENYIFTMPYLPSGIQFFVKKNSVVDTLSEITKGKIGTTDDPLIQTLVKVNYAKSYPIRVYSTPQAGIDALASGTIDAFVMQTATTQYWLEITSDTFKAIGDPIPIGLGNGAVALATPKAAAMIDQINQILQVMQNDGTYLEIYNRYNIK